MDESKRCTQCREIKPLAEFHRDRSKTDGRKSTCKICRGLHPEGDREARAAYHRQYREDNREHLSERQRHYYEANRERHVELKRQYREADRTTVFDHYGWQCACCGTADNPTIDHVNGDGAEHRMAVFGHTHRATGKTFYRWLVKNGFPDGFQTLCRPCNKSKDKGERCRLDHDATVTPITV